MIRIWEEVSGHDTLTIRGRDWAAMMFTLIGSCKLNGVKPEAYLCHVLATSTNHPINKIKDLLPWSLNIPAESLSIRR